MKASLPVIGVLLSLVALPSSGAESAPTRRSSVTNPFITGWFTDATSGQGVFTGNLKLAPFELQGGSMVAIGELKGLLSDSTGEPVRRIDERIVWPVESVQGTCQVVELKLPTIELSLMDVSVHLSPIVLNITSGRQRQKAALDAICSVAQLAGSDPAAGDLTTKLNDLFLLLR